MNENKFFKTKPYLFLTIDAVEKSQKKSTVSWTDLSLFYKSLLLLEKCFFFVFNDNFHKP